MVSLYFQKSLLELDPDEVNQFLFSVAKEKTASSSCFKHTVYGLRFFFRLCGLEDRALRLPSLSNDGNLPVVLSAEELRRGKNGFYYIAEAMKAATELACLDANAQYLADETTCTVEQGFTWSSALPVQVYRSDVRSTDVFCRSVDEKMHELSDHLGNVHATVSDRKSAVLVDASRVVLSASVLSFSDYYPFGMQIPGRNVSTGDYRYGYQGSEKDAEISGEGNSYTTFFRQLDLRLGRWLSFDPKATPWESPYASMGNNPILFNDVLGDTIRGTSQQSAQRTERIIKGEFGTNSNLQAMFKLGSDGISFEAIDEKALMAAVANESEDLQTLAISYMMAINGDELHLSSVLSRSENMDFQTYSMVHPIVQNDGSQWATGADVDDGAGGGVNFLFPDGSGSLTIIVTNSTASIPRKVGNGKSYSAFPNTAGQLLAHELLGHGVSGALGSLTSDHIDAIQISNLYWRAHSSNPNASSMSWRDGFGHDGPTLRKAVATGVPSHFQNYKSALKMKNTLNFFFNYE
jgi:RHS repeat-associated protein